MKDCYFFYVFLLSCILFLGLVEKGSAQQNISDCGTFTFENMVINIENITVTTYRSSIACLQITNSRNVILRGNFVQLITDYNVAAGHPFFISFVSCYNVSVEGISIFRSGIESRLGGGYFKVDQITIKDSFNGFDFTPAQQQDFSVTIQNSFVESYWPFRATVQSVVVYNNDIYFSATGITGNSKNIEIRGNRFYNTGSGNIKAIDLMGPAQSYIVEDNIVTIMPTMGTAEGIAITCSGTSLSLKNNIVQGSPSIATDCVKNFYGYKINFCNQVSSVNNTARNIHVNTKQNTPSCDTTPLFGGFYINNCNATFEGLDISTSPSLAPNYITSQFAIGSQYNVYPDMIFGVFILDSNVTLSNSYIHDIYGGKRVPRQNVEGMAGNPAAGIYIGRGCHETYLFNVTVDGIYGGDSGIVYEATQNNPTQFITTGGNAFGIYSSSGVVFSTTDSIISRVYGGKGIEVTGATNVNCSGGLAKIHSSILSGFISAGESDDGDSCIFPTTGDVFVTTAGSANEDFIFINANAYLTNNIVCSGDCFKIKYGNNFTFYGNGHTIDCYYETSCRFVTAVTFSFGSGAIFDDFKINNTRVILSTDGTATFQNSQFSGYFGYIDFTNAISLISLNNSFSDSFNGIFTQNNANSVIVEDNTFNNVVHAISTQSTTGVIKSNKIFSSINFEVGISVNFINGGEISNNWISGGTTRLPLWVYAVGDTLISNNTVENIELFEVSNDHVYGISVTCQDNPNVTIIHNVVRNFTLSCSAGIAGYYVKDCKFLIADNTVSDFVPPENVTCTVFNPTVDGYHISSSSGLFKSNKANNISGIVGDNFTPSFAAGYNAIVAGVSVMSDSTVHIESCTFDSLSGVNVPNCIDCNDAIAYPVVGVGIGTPSFGNIFPRVYISDLVVSNLKGGNAGNITTVMDNGFAFGGDAYGIYCIYCNVSAHSLRFSNFIAGESGYVNGVKSCSTGRAEAFFSNIPQNPFTDVIVTNLIGTTECRMISECGIYSEINTIINFVRKDISGISGVCLLIVNSNNVTVDGNGCKLSGADTGIQVLNSTNITINKLNFRGFFTAITASESDNVIVIKSIFSFITFAFASSNGSVSFVSNAVDNTQYGFFANNTANVEVSNNTFVSCNRAVEVIMTKEFEINNNYFIIPYQSAIFVSGDYGIIENNIVNVSIALSHFEVHLKSNLETSYITGNSVIDYLAYPVPGYYDCISGVTGFLVNCDNENHNVIMSDNKVDNFMSNCPAYVKGFSVSKCKVTMENTFIHNLLPYDATVIMQTAPTFIGLYFDQGASGTIKNVIIDNLSPNPTNYSSLNDATAIGILLTDANFILENINVSGLIVPNMSSCLDCSLNSGHSATVFEVLNGEYIFTNIRVSNITAGNGGDIHNSGDSLSKGGDVNIFHLSSSGHIVVTNGNYLNMRAGNGGNVTGAQSNKCPGGMVNLKAANCTECLSNITFYGSLEYDNPFMHGYSCAGDIASTTATYPIDTTTSASTTSVSTISSTTDLTTSSTTDSSISSSTGDSTTTADTTTTIDTTTTTDTTSSSLSSSTTGSTNSVSSSSSSTSSSTTGQSGIFYKFSVSYYSNRTTITLSVFVIGELKRNSLESEFNFTVEISDDNSTNWKQVYGESNLYSVIGLKPGTVYFFKVDSVSNIIDPLYVSAATLAPSAPSSPLALRYSALSRSYINLMWSYPLDDGGMPVSNFTLEYQNPSSPGWLVLVFNDSLTYNLTNLTLATSYSFRLFAASSIGYSEASETVEISTASMVCGDGMCDGEDTCSNCYLDCGACGYKSCPISSSHECSGRGTCEKGVCLCNSGWGSTACDLPSNTPVIVVVNTTSPSATVDLGNKDQQEESRYVKFTVSFFDIKEVAMNGSTLDGYRFSEQNFTVSQGSGLGNETVYKTILPNNAVVTLYISFFDKATDVMFANNTISISENGVKYAMDITNWPFKSFSNKLITTMESSGQSTTNPEDDCVTVSTSEDNSFNLRWLKITVNGVVLYGKFVEYALIDGAIKNVQYSYNKITKLVEITIPHFWNTAQFDPDFQVLFSPDEVNEGCDSKQRQSKNSAKIAGIAVGVVVGVALLAGIAIFVVLSRRRNRTKKRISKAANRYSTKLETLPNSTSSSPLYAKNEGENPLYNK